jgi:alkanesulfonate monooxygenase SsuD/methylene tetrahydromethanopterin reductase-like flavin-dependent oxidoreductase (luciferase family)
MEFGVFDHLDRGERPLGALYEMRLWLAELYDRAGFHAYHQAEHHATPLGAAPSPGIFLAALAQRTTRLRFGPLVYTLPLYHPLRLIEEICMLDQMSGGRLEMGVGKGISPHEVRFYGVDPAEAQERYVEALDLILRGLAAEGGALTFRGRYYTVEGVPMTAGPVQRPHPPLWYGIGNLETVPWAARNAVNVVGNLPAPRMHAIADRYRAEWRALGRDPALLPRIGTSRHVVVAETDAEALALARRTYRPWAAAFLHLWERFGGRPVNAAVPPDFDGMAALGRAVAGSPATVRAALAADIEASGVTYLLCRFAFGDMAYEEAACSAGLFARKVMPALREAG